MAGLTPTRLAGLALAAASAAGLGFALFSQHVWGLVPCELCQWQRWPHRVVIVLGLATLLLPARFGRPLLALVTLALLVGAGIALFHVGVEAKWWAGLPSCTGNLGSGASAAELLAQIEATPPVRCDDVQWRLMGLSMAAWNGIACLILAGFAALAAADRLPRRTGHA